MTESEASDLPLPPPDLLARRELLREFINLHQPSFTEAALACILKKGGPEAFDFREHVMFFSLHYRHENPGTAFSLSFADLIPNSELYRQLPQSKELLQAQEERYDSVADFDKATMEHFVCLTRMVYHIDGCLIHKNTAMCYDPQDNRDPVATRPNWLADLQWVIGVGLVMREVEDRYQTGKIVKQGTRWKWVPIPGMP
jgi:hypothetical protein